MLLIKTRLEDIDFRQLMDIYVEGNVENAAYFWPDIPEDERIPKAEQSFHDYLQTDFFAQENARYFIREIDGRYVAALRLEPYQDGLLIEALETRPDCRRQGHAFALIEAVKATVPDRLYAHISKRNTASLRTHEKCGFRRISGQAVYSDGTVNENHCTVVLR